MANMSELEIRLTGGASNSDVTLSTGGVVSSTQVLSQSASSPTTLTGVSITNGRGNPEGVGVLAFTSATKTLKWTPYGGTSGTAVDVSVGGAYSVQGGSNGGSLTVVVTASALPTSNISNNITIANISNTMFIDITKDQSDVGRDVYHCFAIKNTGTDQKKAVKLWINTNTPGQDGITIGLAAAATGNGDSTGIDTDTADETAVPSGVVFSAPTSESVALDVGTLSGLAGSTHTRCFWIKLAVPAGVNEAYLNNSFRLGLSAKV